MNYDDETTDCNHPGLRTRAVSVGFDEDVDQQVARFSQAIIFYPSFQHCMRRIEALHREARFHRKKPRGLLITGLSGVGKSTIAEQYGARYPRVEAEDRTVIPVLYVELPGQPTAKAIGEAILQAMGDPMAHVGTAEFRLGRVRTLLKKCRVEVVFIDEMQHLTDNLHGTARDVAADTLKNLMNGSGIPFVFLGMPGCRSYFTSNQQLNRRCSPKIHLKPFGFKTLIEQENFLRLLIALNDKSPLAEPSALKDAALVWPLNVASHGLVGMLIPLIEEGLRLALSAKAASLGREHLKDAFRSVVYAGASKKRNPFDEKFEGGFLTQRGEPFFGYLDD